MTVPGGLALIERDAPGLHLEVQPTQDGGHGGTLTFNNAPAEALAGDGSDALEQTVLANAAYLLGLMDRAFAITLDYLRTREQFGRKIGSFQALQHRSADLLIEVSLTRAVVRSGGPDPGRAALSSGLSGCGVACETACFRCSDDGDAHMHPVARWHRSYRRGGYRVVSAQGDGSGAALRGAGGTPCQVPYRCPGGQRRPLIRSESMQHSRTAPSHD